LVLAKGVHLPPATAEWAELILKGVDSHRSLVVTKEEARRLFEVLRNLYPEFK